LPALAPVSTSDGAQLQSMKKSRTSNWFDKKTSAGTQGRYRSGHYRKQEGFFHLVAKGN
jgi:hypothetical protein